MKDCLGIINLDENEEKILELTAHRLLGALPIAGRYRVIDFVLSNMTNSGIENIGIFTKNKSRSLVDHLTNGRPWDLNRKKDGLRVFNFGDFNPQYDDVHNFLDNIDFFEKSKREYVLLSPSYMVCNIDYNDLMKYHKESGNDVTVVYKNIKQHSEDKFVDCQVLNLNENSRVIGVGENIGLKSTTNISMEMYIMKTDLFIDIVYKSIKSGMHRKVKDYINANIDSLNVGAFEFTGYLACINSIKAYFDANSDFLNEKVNKELFYSKSPIYTKPKDECATQYTECSNVVNSIIANGSYIEGTVKNCVIGRKVYIGKDTVLENCVILQNSVIGEKVSMKYVITDKGTVIRDGEEVKGLESNPVIIPKKKQF